MFRYPLRIVRLCDEGFEAFLYLTHPTFRRAPARTLLITKPFLCLTIFSRLRTCRPAIHSDQRAYCLASERRTFEQYPTSNF